MTNEQFVAIIIAFITSSLPGIYAIVSSTIKLRHERIARDAEISRIYKEIEEKAATVAAQQIERMNAENKELRDEIARLRDRIQKQDVQYEKLYKQYCDLRDKYLELVEGVRMLVEQVKSMGEMPAYEPDI